MMRASANGVALIKRFEGLELEAYQDIAGVWTIGYGHTGDDVTPGKQITAKEAEELLKKDLSSREERLSKWQYRKQVILQQHEFDALISFIYNVGFGAFEGSTVARKLDEGERMKAANAMLWWNKATVNGELKPIDGLTRRREAERALFLGQK